MVGSVVRGPPGWGVEGLRGGSKQRGPDGLKMPLQGPRIGRRLGFAAFGSLFLLTPNLAAR
jgi:hypothetical protein